MSELLDKAQNALDNLGVKYKIFACDPALADTATFCQEYGFEPGDSANAIIVASKTDPIKYCCCLVLATTRLDVNKAVCKLMEVRKSSFATAEQTIDLTGMEIGGVTVFGLPEGLPIYIDQAVMGRQEIVIGGGNRSSKIVLNPQELEKLSNAEVIEGLARPKD